MASKSSSDEIIVFHNSNYLKHALVEVPERFKSFGDSLIKKNMRVKWEIVH